MRAPIRYTVLLALVLAVILILTVTINTPLIYSLEKDTFPSLFHNNTEALKRQSLNSTEDILPLMQELSGYSGPIILNVRLDDPDQARRDLALFAKNRVAFDNLIVKLDMTESEMREYSRNRLLQNQLLSELVNSSVSLEELKKLEVRYRDADNPTMLMSVQLEGEALHKRIQELYDRYEIATKKTMETDKKAGLDTSPDEESISSFQRYVEETAPEKQSPFEVSPRRTNLLTFIILPEQVSYGDTLGCSGYLFSPVGLRYAGIPDRNVTLFIDNEPVSGAGTDSSGWYAFRLPVERIAAGSHAVYTASGTTLSETRRLTVEWADSVTTLSLGPLTRRGEVTASGSVSAGVPVRNAPVDILMDGTIVLTTTTDAKGQFQAVLKVPPGTHVLVARFTGTGFPIRASESEPRGIDVPLPL
ncbi:MAG: carboxypeptidase-like regulatory domain-containing protein, partial [Methanoregula sp.]|nr:carboxypeptidase-like regulatory domain-containing protein [Methanoregula sp.]